MRQCPKRDGETAERETDGQMPIDDNASPSRATEGPILAALVEEPLRPRRPATTPWKAPFGLETSRPAVSVPRRFSVGTMMILVTAFAMLLGILKSCGVHPAVFGTVAAFIAGVGACQVLLFQGRDPRRASFYGGMITFGVLAVIVAAITSFLSNNLEVFIGMLFWGAVLAGILGGPLGYAAGCLVAAIFLVRKEPGNDESTAEETVEPGPCKPAG